MSRIMMSSSRRRVYTFIAAGFVLLFVFTIYANPGITKSTAHYIEDWSRPGYEYLTGTKDPDSLIGEYEQGAAEPHDFSASTTSVFHAQKPPPPAPTASQTTEASWPAHFGTSIPSIDHALEDYEEDDGDLTVPPAYIADPDVHEIVIGDPWNTHYQIESISGKNGNYVDLDFLGHMGLNPSIIPHPYIKNNFLMVAQRDKDERTFSPFFAEMVCEAIWTGEKLQCNGSSTILPITFSQSRYCDWHTNPMYGQLNMNIGPHDARVFMGPQSSAYILYGSQSDHDDMCFGQHIQDLRMLLEWGPFIAPDLMFNKAVSIRRPPPRRGIEKNYFVFWDKEDQIYAHYDLEPRRSFSRIDPDGKHHGNLAQRSRATDEPCWERWVKETAYSNGTHQATNSLMVTLCNRADKDCVATDANTKIMTIFQKKLSYNFHAFYLPFVLLFDRTPPFAMHAITAKPFWVKGQRAPNEPMPPHEQVTVHGNITSAFYQPEMLYMTAMNWKIQGLDYHGYLDDVLWLSFGREDTWMGAVDVTAGALLGDMKTWIECPARD